jgi:CubicO group peptidase (beta-lactamase class C family)
MTQAWGIADLEHTTPATVESAYEMGSITKSVTAHAVLQLVVAGRVSLTGKVSDYISDCPKPAADATIHQLLTHTSGIPDYVNDNVPELKSRVETDSLSREEILHALASQPLKFPSGSRYKYSNSNYYLLGLIVERVTGRDFYDVVQHDVLQPLGVGPMFSGNTLEIVPQRARAYRFDDKGMLQNTPPFTYLTFFSAGSLVATPTTLGRYRRAVFMSDKMDPRVRDLIMTTVPVAEGGLTDYTMGALNKTHFAGLLKFAHAGGSWGHASYNAYYPERDVTIVVMGNRHLSHAGPDYLERKIARILFDVPDPAVRPALAFSSARYVGIYKRVGGYVGRYRSHGSPLYYSVAEEHGQLAVGAGERPDDPLLQWRAPIAAIAQDEFGYAGDGLEPDPEREEHLLFDGSDVAGHAKRLRIGDITAEYAP